MSAYENAYRKALATVASEENNRMRYNANLDHARSSGHCELTRKEAFERNMRLLSEAINAGHHGSTAIAEYLGESTAWAKTWLRKGRKAGIIYAAPRHRHEPMIYTLAGTDNGIQQSSEATEPEEVSRAGGSASPQEARP